MAAREKRLYTILLLLFAQVVYGNDKLSGKLNIVVNFSDITTLPTHLYIRNTGLYYNSDAVDTVKVTGRHFSYTTHLAEPSRIKISLAWADKRIRSTTFWAFPATYELRSQNMTPLITGGDPAHARKLIDIENAEMSNLRAIDSLIKMVDYRTQTIQEAENRIMQIRDSMAINLDEMVYKQRILDRNEVASLYALMKYSKSVLYRRPFKTQQDSIRALLNNLDPELKELPSAVTLHQQLQYSLKLFPGNSITDIGLRDTIGKTVRISDYKGMYLLVEFWASWCGPCRREAPALIQLYQKYKPSNFRIISISRDELSFKRAWTNAIRMDQIGIWPQLSDFDKKAQELYDISVIPANFLIDPQGKIIGKNLRGTELSLTLAKLFEH